MMRTRIAVAGAVTVLVLGAAFLAASDGRDGPAPASRVADAAPPSASPAYAVGAAERYVPALIPSPDRSVGRGAFIVRATMLPVQKEPAFQARESDVVVWGTVVEVRPARWNSADGKEWNGTEGDMPIVYTTFLVEPREVMKGKPAWGTPVAFRTLGGVYGDGRVGTADLGVYADLSVGDEIIVMGVDHPFYGGTYEMPAYWSLVNATSVYRGDEKSGFRRLDADPGDPEAAAGLSLESARSLASVARQ